MKHAFLNRFMGLTTIYTISNQNTILNLVFLGYKFNSP